MRLLRRLHRWLGLALAVPMIVQAISGCILAADPLVADLLAPAIAPQARPPDDVGAIAAVAAATAPGLVVRRYQVGEGGAAVISLAAPGSPAVSREVVVDPILARVLDMRAPGGFVRWVRVLHEHLLLAEFGGRSVVGWFGVGLLFLAVSGIPLWWPQTGRWRAAMTVSPKARGWRLQRQMHGAAGIWIVAMLLLQSVSGITLAFPQTARAVLGLPQGGGRRLPSAHDVPFDVAAVARAARLAVPDGVLEDLRLPPGRPTTALFRAPDQWPGAPPTVVTLGTDAHVLSVQAPGGGLLVLGWLRALHYGEGLGSAWRLMVCLAGAGLTLLPVTGVAMWLLQRRNRRRIARRKESALQGAGE